MFYRYGMFVVLCLSFVVQVLADEYINPCAENECNFYDKCYKKGEVFAPTDSCEAFECLGFYGQTKKAWCNQLDEILDEIPPGCTAVPETIGKPYPECCSRFQCSKNTANYTGEGMCDLVDGCFFAGKCYNKGQKFTHPDYCSQVTCHGYNQTNLLSCAIPSVSGECTVIESSPGPYPECCPKVKCP